MNRKPDLTKRVVTLMDAIDKHAPTELPKTEEQTMSLIQSLVRPIVWLLAYAEDGGAS